MNENLKQFDSLIKDLESLKKIKPGRELRYRINKMLLPSLPVRRKFFTPILFGLRPLALAILILIFTGSSIVAASQNAKPGDFLYPVKTTVAGIMSKIHNNEYNQVIISPTPTQVQTQKSNTKKVSPTPTIDEEVQEIIIELENPVESVAPILITPSVTPSPVVNLTHPDMPIEVKTEDKSIKINLGGLNIDL